MPSRPMIYSSGTPATTAISGATEVVVATCAGVTDIYAGQTIKLIGRALITTPGSTTSVAIQVRRVSLTGTQVGDSTPQAITAAAGTSNFYEVYAQDAPGDVANVTYVLTVTCTAGSGAGSCVYAVLEARVD
jgi:hypothetical protein